MSATQKLKIGAGVGKSLVLVTSQENACFLEQLAQCGLYRFFAFIYAAAGK
jgi:hypothetical protein